MWQHFRHIEILDVFFDATFVTDVETIDFCDIYNNSTGIWILKKNYDELKK